MNLFLRGLVPLVGLKSTKVYFDRLERMAGESKYPLKKMLAFSLDGITSFSITPIRLVNVYGNHHFITKCSSGSICVIQQIVWCNRIRLDFYYFINLVLGGIQLISLGLIGEYIGKIYKETKHRPKYFIEQRLVLNKRKKSIMRRFLSKEFILFALVGVSNTVINFIVYTILVFFNMPYLIANIIGYGVGMINSYLLNKYFVFQRKREIFRYLLSLFLLISLQ